MTPRSLRVLLVVGAMNRGGIETWLMNIARALPPERVELSFLVHSERPSDFDDEIDALGHRTVVCVLGRDPLTYARRLGRILRTEGPYDAIHSFVSTFSAVPLMVSRMVGVPVRIAHSQTDRRPALVGVGVGRRLYTTTASWLVRRSMTQGMACTEGAAEFLFMRSPRTDSRVRIVPNAIDPRPFAGAEGHLRQELGLAPTTTVVGHIGRFVPVKNQAFLVEVAARWQEAGTDAHLVLVGDGPDRRLIEEMAATAGLSDRVHLTGLRSDIPQILADLDVLLLPSLWEGAPITLVEAQASGVPCVVSDAVHGATDVVPGLVTSMPAGAGAEAWARASLRVLADERPTREEAQRVMTTSPWNLERVIPLLVAAWSGGPVDDRG